MGQGVAAKGGVMHGSVWLRVVWAGVLWALLAGSLPAQEAASPNVGSGPNLEQPGTGQTYSLVYKLTPGLFAHYQSHQLVTVSVQHAEAQEQVTNDVTTFKHFRVVSRDADGLAVLEPVIEKVRMSATFNGDPPIVFDSETDQTAPRQFRDVQATIGRALSRMTVAPNGQLMKISVLDGAPATLTAAAQKVDPQSNFLVVFPAQPIGVGAVWSEKFQVPVTLGKGGLSQMVTLRRRYQLTGVTNAIAQVSMTTSVLTPIDNNPEVQGQLIQRSPSASIQFDMEKGLIISQVTTVAKKEVVGAFGPKSTMQAASEVRETWIEAPPTLQPAAATSSTAKP